MSGVISEEYLSLNREMHVQRDDYGVMAVYHKRELQILTRLVSRDVLDYGCGKRMLELGLGMPIANYDPAIPGLDEPPHPADVVACVDVLEHVEPDRIEAVLADLARVTRRVGYFEISTTQASKDLPDGRNAHLLIRPASWWLARMSEHFQVLRSIEAADHVTYIVAPQARGPAVCDSATQEQPVATAVRL